mmetsp:Transcript_8707/g.19114  ORF Transcript_8707/g.19114 Transcript_8707/m.19114 type:complete len:394 (-) Transcript_8707:1119-2300(-)
MVRSHCRADEDFLEVAAGRHAYRVGGLLEGADGGLLALLEVDDAAGQAQLHLQHGEALLHECLEDRDAPLEGGVWLLACGVHEVLAVQVLEDGVHDHHLVHPGSADGVQHAVAQLAEGGEAESADEVVVHHGGGHEGRVLIAAAGVQQGAGCAECEAVQGGEGGPQDHGEQDRSTCPQRVARHDQLVVRAVSTLSQGGLQRGVHAVIDLVQRLCGLQLCADAECCLQHACVCEAALPIESELRTHSVQRCGFADSVCDAVLQRERAPNGDDDLLLVVVQEDCVHLVRGVVLEGHEHQLRVAQVLGDDRQAAAVHAAEVVPLHHTAAHAAPVDRAALLHEAGHAGAAGGHTRAASRATHARSAQSADASAGPHVDHDQVRVDGQREDGAARDGL